MHIRTIKEKEKEKLNRKEPYMKKALAFILAALMAGSVLGCASSTSETEKKKKSKKTEKTEESIEEPDDSTTESETTEDTETSEDPDPSEDGTDTSSDDSSAPAPDLQLTGKRKEEYSVYGDGSRYLNSVTYYDDDTGLVTREEYYDYEGAVVYSHDYYYEGELLIAEEELLDYSSSRRTSVTTQQYKFEYDQDGKLIRKYGNRTVTTIEDDEEEIMTFNLEQTFEYDDQGQLIHDMHVVTSDEAGEETTSENTYSYDDRGNLIEQVNPYNSGARYTYDDQDRVIVQEEFISGKITCKVEYEYNDQDQVVLYTEYYYDSQEEQISEGAFLLKYDDEGRLIRLEDASATSGHWYEYIYYEE